jgi:uncharacterized protein (DUF885 family)
MQLSRIPSGVRRRSAALCVLVALTSFGPASAQGVSGHPADAHFEALAHDYYYAGFKASPVGATFVGLHDYDADLDDVSASAQARHVALDRRTLAAIRGIDPFQLSSDVALDRTILDNSIEDDLLLTNRLQQWKHNPDGYTGTASGSIFGLISRTFAPLPVRMRDAIARERQLPRFFAQATANITTVDAETKKISYLDTVGSVDFFAQTVPQAFATVRDAKLQSQLRAANAGAIAAVRRYAAFIGRIAPSGTYAIGKDAYEARLRYEDSLDIPVDRYLAYGFDALHRTRAQFLATSKRIDPRKTPQQNYAALAVIHPAPSRLNATAQQDLVRLRAFLISHHIITLPPDADIQVVDTPSFERSFVTASMDSPGPLETVATRAYYNVTPVDPSWPAARTAGFLAQFNDFQRPLISAHEVYPGHFVNFTIDKHLDLSLTRRLLWNSEFGEGWAHYGEQMMVDEGWGGGDPRVRLAQLSEALLRECRYVVGVGLHVKGWTPAYAEHVFTDQCFQTPAVAEEETMRGTQDPMYGYYTLGKMMILKLREDYKKKLGPAYTLEKFHDALLAHGDPSVPLLRPLLLGSDDDGKPL